MPPSRSAGPVAYIAMARLVLSLISNLPSRLRPRTDFTIQHSPQLHTHHDLAALACTIFGFFWRRCYRDNNTAIFSGCCLPVRFGVFVGQHFGAHGIFQIQLRAIGIIGLFGGGIIGAGGVIQANRSYMSLSRQPLFQLLRRIIVFYQLELTSWRTSSKPSSMRCWRFFRYSGWAVQRLSRFLLIPFQHTRRVIQKARANMSLPHDPCRAYPLQHRIGTLLALPLLPRRTRRRQAVHRQFASRRPPQGLPEQYISAGRGRVCSVRCRVVNRNLCVHRPSTHAFSQGGVLLFETTPRNWARSKPWRRRRRTTRLADPSGDRLFEIHWSSVPQKFLRGH
ncbi:hypothetical protein B0H17DRAFT_156466 [Mycena rosella]|uniref:Uncharacterized protein n=1 Tax=Mycena rosella TaxID=1033263 RepID=A0AAD7GA32_MYCRO|nr:hypothetical protein B0H17DRAFT_156466 [Mycena rosella]